MKRSDNSLKNCAALTTHEPSFGAAAAASSAAGSGGGAPRRAFGDRVRKSSRARSQEVKYIQTAKGWSAFVIPRAFSGAVSVCIGFLLIPSGSLQGLPG